MNYDIEIKTTHTTEILRYDNESARNRNWEDLIAFVKSPSQQFTCGDNILLNRDYIITIKRERV